VKFIADLMGLCPLWLLGEKRLPTPVVGSSKQVAHRACNHWSIR